MAAVEGVATAAVGISTRPVCGVRDHAEVLAEALERQQVACSLHWLARGESHLAHSDGSSVRANDFPGRGDDSPARGDGSLARGAGALAQAHAEVGAWTRRLADELEHERPDAVLWHYSVFAYAYRGLPLFVPPTLAVLRRAGVPVVTVMHEPAYPWLQGGLRGCAWAATHRAVLAPVVRASAAVLVTADFRAQWLTSRPWLPRRPVAVAPVFSNLPAPTPSAQPPANRATPADPSANRATPTVGLFGYAFEQSSIALVLDALRLLRDRGCAVRLTLLGAPGPSSAAGRAWSAAAESRGVASQLSLSGVLSAQALSDALAACEILLYADPTGPASRKGTLAASLGSGRPVVALEGRRRWPELLGSGAAHVAPRSRRALAESIETLLGDEDTREALGARGRAFAGHTMSSAHAAEVVRGLLGEVLAGS